MRLPDDSLRIYYVRRPDGTSIRSVGSTDGGLTWSDDRHEFDLPGAAYYAIQVFPDDEGAYLIRGRLEPQVAALLMRAIEAASDALYQGSVPETTPEQRRADALALLVERALERGFEDCGPSREAEGVSEETARVHLSMSERYTVIVHVDADGLREDGENGGAGPPDGPTSRPDFADAHRHRRGLPGGWHRDHDPGPALLRVKFRDFPP